MMLKSQILSIVFLVAFVNCHSQKSIHHEGYIVAFGSQDSILNQAIANDSLKSKLFILISRNLDCYQCFYIELQNSNELDQGCVESVVLSSTNTFYNAGNDLLVPVIFYDMTNFVKRNYGDGVRHCWLSQPIVRFKFNSLKMKLQE